MYLYLEAVQKQLRLELGNKVLDKFLLRELRAHSFMLRQERAEWACNKMGLEFTEPEYYRDVQVFLPDARHGEEAMPPCPGCRTGKHVTPHGFRDDHFARRVTCLNGHRFLMSRRCVWVWWAWELGWTWA